MEKDEKSKLKKEVEEQEVEEKKETKKPKKKKLSELELLKEENEKLKEELSKNAEGALRALAELENYKKRSEKEKADNQMYYNMGLIEELLNPLDQLNLVVNAQVESKELQNYLKGFKMINDLIFQVLEGAGLKQIKTENEMFDPKYHEAVDKLSDKEKENGIILQTRQTGYIFRERILRPALVIVNEWSEENEENK